MSRFFLSFSTFLWSLATFSSAFSMSASWERDLYRVACACGQASPRWSVSESAAVRLWNETMAGGEKKKDAS